MKRKFVLVHNPRAIEQAKADVAAAGKEPLKGRLGRFVSSNVGAVLGQFGSSMFGYAIRADGAQSMRITLPKPAPRVTVGIWNLGAWLGSLSALIETLNRQQSTFVFFEVEAPVPSGLISRPERMIPWLMNVLGKDLTEEDRLAIQDNLIANDFYGLADGFRADFGLDYVVGITPSMVAGDDDGDYYWNHFSNFEGRAILTSSYQLREFAQKSGLSFDAFLLNIIVSQLLVAMFWPGLFFHRDKGCLFDQDIKRVGLIEKVRNPLIEPSCMAHIDPEYRDAAGSLVDFLNSIRSAKT